jgi:L-lactate dehydrogenase complex protein LldE
MKQISLFIPCLVDLFMPEVGEACLAVFEHLRVQAVYHPEQTCCGQPAITGGYRSQAKHAAKHFIEIFENDDAIVCPSGSCVHTVRNHYPDLLADEPEWRQRAEDLALHLYEFSEFLVDVLAVEDIGGKYAGKVVYHESCQLLRGLNISEQPRKLIRAVEGTELSHWSGADKCCGFGGEFSVQYPEISEAMVEEKVTQYIESGADLLVACDPGCLLNIGGYLSRHHPDKKAIHLAIFLAEAVKDGRA